MYLFIFFFLISCDVLDWLETDDKDDKRENSDKEYVVELTPPQQLVSGYEFSFRVSLYDEDDASLADVSATASLAAECDGKAQEIDDQEWSKGEATFTATFELDAGKEDLECEFLAETKIGDKVFKSEAYTVVLVRQVELAVIGDSLATGVFSDQSMGNSLTNAEAVKHPLVAGFISSLLNGKQFSREKMDEYLITHHENPFTCAANGNKEQCKFSYQQQMNIKNHHAKNFAKSGSKADDLLDQLDALGELIGKANTYLVSVGGNNFCDESFDKTAYLASMQAIIDKIKAQNSAAKILIMPIPNVLGLFAEVAISTTKAITITDLQPVNATLSLTCGQIRDGHDIAIVGQTKKLEPFCPRISKGITGENDAVSAFVTAQEQLWTDTNKGLVDLAADDSNIEVAESIANATFTITDMAVDCFHPNKSGQKIIANELIKYNF